MFQNYDRKDDDKSAERGAARNVIAQYPKRGQFCAMKTALQAALVLLCVFCFSQSRAAEAKQPATEPPVIDPGPIGGPPSDALVLFDGHDLSHWKGEHGGQAKWKVDNGVMEVNGTGNIVTTEEFGDVQVHAEWAAPSEVRGEGQGRGNSGVYLQGRYEIQVLDSYQNKTYFNGQAGALYGVAAPLVNACRKPGEWQSYDIIFHAPRRSPDGNVEPGSVTVLHNGVLVLDHVAVAGESTTAAAFQGVVAKGPLMLQDHGNPVRFRNIWIRRL